MLIYIHTVSCFPSIYALCFPKFVRILHLKLFYLLSSIQSLKIITNATFPFMFFPITGKISSSLKPPMYFWGDFYMGLPHLIPFGILFFAYWPNSHPIPKLLAIHFLKIKSYSSLIHCPAYQCDSYNRLPILQNLHYYIHFL